MMSKFSKNASVPEIHLAQIPRKRLSSLLTLLGLVCVFGFSSGCSTLLGKTKGPLDNLDTKSLKQQGYTFGQHGAERPLHADGGAPAIVLEVKNGKRSFEKIPMVPGQSLFVADLIRDAGLHKKIGRIKTTILRPNGANRPPVRLDVDFDDSGKHVMEGQNYSLRPGDHVVISPDDKSMLAGVMPSLPFTKK